MGILRRKQNSRRFKMNLSTNKDLTATQQVATPGYEVNQK